MFLEIIKSFIYKLKLSNERKIIKKKYEMEMMVKKEIISTETFSQSLDDLSVHSFKIINHQYEMYKTLIRDFLVENYKNLDIRNGIDYKVEIVLFMLKSQNKYVLEGLEDTDGSIFQCLIKRPDGVNIKQSISLEKMTELFVDEIFYDASGLYFNEIKSKYKKKE